MFRLVQVLNPHALTAQRALGTEVPNRCAPPDTTLWMEHRQRDRFADDVDDVSSMRSVLQQRHGGHRSDSRSWLVAASITGLYHVGSTTFGSRPAPRPAGTR